MKKHIELNGAADCFGTTGQDTSARRWRLRQGRPRHLFLLAILATCVAPQTGWGQTLPTPTPFVYAGPEKTPSAVSGSNGAYLPACGGVALAEVSTCAADISTEAQAIACLSAGSTFFTRNSLPPIALKSTTFDRDTLWSVVRWAAKGPMTSCREQILVEAADRLATGLAFIGNFQLIYGMNLDFSRESNDTTTQLIPPDRIEQLTYLDSRRCVIPGTTPQLRAASCTTYRDCEGELGVNPECRAVGVESSPGLKSSAIVDEKRLSTVPKGAVQLYREAEAAILTAFNSLGDERTQEVDLARGSSCQGIGCLSDLLVRVATLRVKAQRQRLEMMWEDAIAQTGVFADGGTCESGSDVGKSCRLHRDCVQGGRCGGPDRSSGKYVLLREATDEAVAETSLSLAYMSRVLPAAVTRFGTRSDNVNLLSFESGKLFEISQRPFSGVTPFGLPSDYVPILNGNQKGALDCTENQSGRLNVLNYKCFENLLTQWGTGGLLGRVKSALTGAKLSRDVFVQQVAEEQADTNDPEANLRSEITQIFGKGTPCSGAGCCSSEQTAKLTCFAFGGMKWTPEIANCDASSVAGGASCDDYVGERADGSLEINLVDYKLAEVGRQTALEDLNQLFQQIDNKLEEKRRLQAIDATACDATTAEYSKAKALINQIIEREKSSGGWFKGLLGGIVKIGLGAAACVITSGAACAPTLTAVAGSLGLDAVKPILGDPDGMPPVWNIASVTQPNNSPRSASPAAAEGAKEFSPAMAAAGAVTEGLQGALSGFLGDQQRNSELSSEQSKNDVQFSLNIALTRIQCQATNQRLEVQYEGAINDLLTQRNNIEAEIQKAEYSKTRVMGAINASMTQLFDSISRYQEAKLQKSLLFKKDPSQHPMLAISSTIQSLSSARSKMREARRGTWLALRSIAYALGKPDLTDRLNAAGGTYRLKNGDSLQAVFKAKTIEELNDLLQNGLDGLLSLTNMQCETNACFKTVSLRRTLLDGASPATFAKQANGLNAVETERTPFGEYLAQRIRMGDDGLEAVVEFSVTDSPTYQVCRQTKYAFGQTGQVECAPAAVVPLNLELTSFGTGQAGDAVPSNQRTMWGARHYRTSMNVTWVDPYTRPDQIRCRDAITGEIKSEVFTGSFQGCVDENVECRRDGCGPDGKDRCFCSKLFNNAGSLEIQLDYAGRGSIRASGSSAAPADDKTLDYTFIGGVAPLLDGASGSVGITGASRRPFVLTAYTPDLSGNAPVPGGATDSRFGATRTDFQFLPVVNSLYRVRIQSPVKVQDPSQDDERAKFETMLKTIQDIQIKMEFDAFKRQ